MIIPYNELSKETLEAIAESVVLREGTDYGLEEITFSEKVEQLLASLKRGDSVLLYSEVDESVDIVPKDNIPMS